MRPLGGLLDILVDSHLFGAYNYRPVPQTEAFSGLANVKVYSMVKDQVTKTVLMDFRCSEYIPTPPHLCATSPLAGTYSLLGEIARHVGL